VHVAEDAVARIDAAARTRRERAEAAQVVAGKERLGAYDVFLCYNSKDKQAVKTLALALRSRGLLPWLDETDLRPGLSWQEQIETQLPKIAAVAVIVGPSGLGPWQDKESRAALQLFANADRPVIPALLPGATMPSKLPLFLRDYHWVDFGAAEPNPLDQLEWGITGRRRERIANPELE
jgi:hypothetical protein